MSAAAVGRRVAANQVDPTGTKTLREQYARQLRKRYRALIRQTVRVVREDTALNLGELAALQEFPRPTPTPTVPPPATPGYPFPERDPTGAINDFVDWFDNAAGTYTRAPDGWSDEYVRYAYVRGADFAQQNLNAQGIQMPDVDVRDTFAMPVHQRDARIFFARQFHLLDGVNTRMSGELSRVLTESYLEGVGPGEAARRINGTLPQIAIPRSNAIARTELVHAYNEANLNELERALGPAGEVAPVVEFASANDDRVCPECESLNGEVFRIEDAHGIIPVHVNCRCTWIPR